MHCDQREHCSGEVEGHCILNAVNVIYERMKRMEPDMVIRTMELICINIIRYTLKN